MTFHRTKTCEVADVFVDNCGRQQELRGGGGNSSPWRPGVRGGDTQHRQDYLTRSTLSASNLKEQLILLRMESSIFKTESYVSQCRISA